MTRAEARLIEVMALHRRHRDRTPGLGRAWDALLISAAEAVYGAHGARILDALVRDH